MKHLLILFIAISFSIVAFASSESNQEVNDWGKIEITKAINDYNNGAYDDNGSIIYKETMKELNKESIKTHYGYYHHDHYVYTSDDDVILVFFAALFASLLSQEVYSEAVASCIDRCLKWDNLSYSSCRIDCRNNTSSH